MNDMLTVAKFTLRNKLTAKSFIVTTVIMALIISIAIHIPYIISLFNSDSSSSDEPVTIGVLAESSSTIPGKLQDAIQAQEEQGIAILLLDAASLQNNQAELSNMMQSGVISGYLELTEQEGSLFPTVVYKSEESTPDQVIAALSQALQIIKVEVIGEEIGLSGDQLQQLYTPVQIDTQQVNENGQPVDGKENASGVEAIFSSTESTVNAGFVYFMVIGLFMAIMISGQLIASEVTSEKSSRIMEVLITSTSPLAQMFGKILGVFTAAITQTIFFALVIVINLNLPHNSAVLSDLNIDLSVIDPMLIVYAVIFYLMGFFLYSTLYAAIGSIVSRTEDLGQAVMPITFLSLGAFYIALFGQAAPDAAFIKISAFIPFFTPFVMFMRMGMSDVAAWQIWLSIGILAVAIYACSWLSAKIYRTGVLMYGKRPSFKEIRKAMKAYKI